MDRDSRKRFYRLTIFNTLTNVTVPLVGIVDTAILGHLPDLAILGGVALASVIFDFLYYGLGFLRMGTTGLTAQATEHNDVGETPVIFWRGLTLALVLGLVIIAGQSLIEWIGFTLSSGGEEVKRNGREYFHWRIWGAPTVTMQLVISGWLLGQEKVRLVLFFTAFINLTNLILTYTLVILFSMGAAGAGLATMLSQTGGFLLAFTVLSFTVLKKPDWKQVFEAGGLISLFKLNGNIFVRTLALILSFAAFINTSAYLGTFWLVVNSILQKLITAVAYMIDGFAIAVETMAGRAWGKRDFTLIKALVKFSLVNSLVFGLVLLAGLFIRPQFVLGALTNHNNVIQASLDYLPWLIPYLLLAAPAWVFDGLFIGLTRGSILRNSMLLSLLVYSGFVIWAVKSHSNHILWLALCVMGGMRTLTLAITYSKEFYGSSEDGILHR